MHDACALLLRYPGSNWWMDGWLKFTWSMERWACVLEENRCVKGYTISGCDGVRIPATYAVLCRVVFAVSETIHSSEK